MSKEKHRNEAATDDEHEGGHPFALGVLTGAAVGVGVGMLLAPRSGAELRKEVGHQFTNMKGSCATGYNRAKDTAGNLAERSRRAYSATRDKVVNGAHETKEYVKEVSDAVTRKAHREPEPRSAVRSDLSVAATREPTRAIGPRG